MYLFCFFGPHLTKAFLGGGLVYWLACDHLLNSCFLCVPNCSERGLTFCAKKCERDHNSTQRLLMMYLVFLNDVAVVFSLLSHFSSLFFAPQPLMSTDIFSMMLVLFSLFPLFSTCTAPSPVVPPAVPFFPALFTALSPALWGFGLSQSCSRQPRFQPKWFLENLPTIVLLVWGLSCQSHDMWDLSSIRLL